jgi:hypothetical protein
VITATVPGVVPDGCTRVVVIGAVIKPVPEYCKVVVTKPVFDEGPEPAGVMTAMVPGFVPDGCTRVVVIGAVIEPVPEYCRVVVTKPVFDEGAEPAGVITAMVPGLVPDGGTRVVVMGAVIDPVPEYCRVVVTYPVFEGAGVLLFGVVDGRGGQASKGTVVSLTGGQFGGYTPSKIIATNPFRLQKSA